MPREATEEKRQQWRKRILNQRTSGLPVAAWCRQHNIVTHTFRYWQDKLFSKQLIDRSSFQEIAEMQEPSPQKQATGIFLRFLEFDIHIVPVPIFFVLFSILIDDVISEFGIFFS